MIMAIHSPPAYTHEAFVSGKVLQKSYSVEQCQRYKNKKMQLFADRVTNEAKLVSNNFMDVRKEGVAKEKETSNELLEKIIREHPEGSSYLELKGKKISYDELTIESDLLEDYEVQIQKNKFIKDKMMEKTSQSVSNRNSLFYNRGDLRKDGKARKLLSICNNINKAMAENPEDFTEYPFGGPGSLYYKKEKVIFKREKNPSIIVSSYMIRHYMDFLGIANLILPTREVWREKNYKLDRKDGKLKSCISYIENEVKDIVPIKEAQDLYLYDGVSLNNAIEDLVRIACLVDIRGLYKHSDTSRCKCNFSNLALVKTIDRDNKVIYRFALLNLDEVTKPSEESLKELVKMFPDHKDLISRTIEESIQFNMRETRRDMREDHKNKFLYCPNKMKSLYKTVLGCNVFIRDEMRLKELEELGLTKSVSDFYKKRLNINNIVTKADERRAKAT